MERSQADDPAALAERLRPLFQPLPGSTMGLLAPLTSIVGRERELALAQSLILRPDVRLLTLTGPGGIGKTRLALELAATLATTFSDGVRFVSLASIREADLVAMSIAHALGILPSDDISVHDAVSTAIQEMSILLVVDNFEHLLAATPVLADLLARCPRLKILATSRVLLRVAGEQALAVPPLPLPDPRSSPSLENLAQSPAIQFFTDRARSVDVSFALTETSAPHVAEICRRVDGLPLAIELVAPRVRHLALPVLLERLSQRLPLLTGGSRDQPSRLQTMRNAIAWSYDLLPPDMQRMFRCVAIFTGGFSLEAAEYIGREATDRDGSDAPGSDLSVVDGLAALIDASLLHLELLPDGVARYRMLETIREYAVEQLAASDEELPVRSAHAAYFLDFAERFELADWLPEDVQAVALLEIERANIRAALTWLSETEQPERLLQLATALGRFWLGQGYYQEGYTWLTRALAHECAPAMADRAKALVSLGMIEAFQGAIREAGVHLAEGLDGCQSQGHMVFAASALIGLGGMANIQGDFEQGVRYLNEALSVAKALADCRLAGIMAGWALINLAVVARTQGDLPLATVQLEEALNLERHARYARATILALGDLGDLARDTGDYRKAFERYQEALDLVRENSGIREVVDVVEAVAITAVAIGETERGARLLGATEALRERIGLRFRIPETQVALDQAVTAARTALDRAAFASVWAAGRVLSSSQAVAEARQPIDFPADAPQPATTADTVPGTLLTTREQEILILMAAGLTDPAIAARIFLSVRTVENHVHHILAKTGVRTRTAAVSAAIAAGLIQAEPPTQA